MSDSRIFFPSCPGRFEALMAEFLTRVDPARTGCMENGVDDEYDYLVEDITKHLVKNDGVLTESDWAELSGETFGVIDYPFTEANVAVFKTFFPEAMVHVNGVQV